MYCQAMGTNVVKMVPLEEQPLSRRVSANIRAEIARSGMQQLDVARALGISQQAVSLKLHDKRPLTLEEIETLASLFGMEPDELLRSPRRPGPFGPDGARQWAPWGSNPQPTD